MLHHRFPLFVCSAGFLALAHAGQAAVTAWPAEIFSAATNITSVEEPLPNDFKDDLSGAYYSPATQRLWLCRNGPEDNTSKVWALISNGSGGYAVDARNGLRAEWTGFGDAEAVTQADPASDIVYVMAEGVDIIRAYNMATYGTATLLRSYNVSGSVPSYSGGLGSEGLAFVPDEALTAGGFVDSAGNPRTSTGGLGGLFFVGHQNGGKIYVFDCSATSNTVTFVGSYATTGQETAEVTFDPQTNHLFIFHGDSVNQLEETTLGSTLVGGVRTLNNVQSFARPTGSTTSLNIEGIAITNECTSGHRRLFLTVDDGGNNSLFVFNQFPCVCVADANHSSTVTVTDIFTFLAEWFAGNMAADANLSGTVTVNDIFFFLSHWFAGC